MLKAELKFGGVVRDMNNLQLYHVMSPIYCIVETELQGYIHASWISGLEEGETANE